MPGPTAFQPNAFQNNAFQIGVASTTVGTKEQPFVEMFYGPTVGDVYSFLYPQLQTPTVGIINVTPGQSFIPCEPTLGPLTVNLPPVAGWASRPQNAPLNQIIVLDVTGNAATNNITITPSGAEKIDGLSSVVIKTNFGLVSIIPNQDLSGWSIT